MFKIKSTFVSIIPRLDTTDDYFILAKYILKPNTSIYKNQKFCFKNNTKLKTIPKNLTHTPIQVKPSIGNQ